jgi:hypothetical protein
MKSMERVREEWTSAWKKIMLDYDESFYQELSLPDNREFLRLLRKYIREGALILEGVVDMDINVYCSANIIKRIWWV